MKKILLILLLLNYSESIFAQNDYCDDIKNEVDEMKGDVIYRSPSLKHLKCYKPFFRDGAGALTMHICIHGTTADYSGKGVYIKFEDGTIIRNESLPIRCSYSGSAFGEPPYLLQAFFEIDETNIKSFSSKKIVKVQLNFASQEINNKEAEKTMYYLQCLYAKTK